MLKGSPVVPPINPSSNISSEDLWGGKGVSVTPLGKECGNSIGTNKFSIFSTDKNSMERRF